MSVVQMAENEEFTVVLSVVATEEQEEVALAVVFSRQFTAVELTTRRDLLMPVGEGP